MTPDEVYQLLEHAYSTKQKAIVQLFYSSGLRLEELRCIKIADIDSNNMRIKVVQRKAIKIVTQYSHGMHLIHCAGITAITDL